MHTDPTRAQIPHAHRSHTHTDPTRTQIPHAHRNDAHTATNAQTNASCNRLTPTGSVVRRGAFLQWCCVASLGVGVLLIGHFFFCFMLPTLETRRGSCHTLRGWKVGGMKVLSRYNKDFYNQPPSSARTLPPPLLLLPLPPSFPFSYPIRPPISSCLSCPFVNYPAVT